MMMYGLCAIRISFGNSRTHWHISLEMSILILHFPQAGTPVQIGDIRVMLQYVPESNKSGREKRNGCYLKVWIRQASGLKTRYDNGTFVLW